MNVVRARRGIVSALTLMLGLTVNCAMASDWVEDDVVDFQSPRQAVPDAWNRQSHQRPPVVDGDDVGSGEDSTSMPVHAVEDHGRGGQSYERKGSRLEGNVARFGAGKTAAEHTAPPTRLPIPATVAVQPKAFRLWLEKTHPNASSVLQSLGKEAIVEVRGRWDDSGHALHSFGFPYSRMSTAKLPSADLSKTRILIVDCAGEIPREAVPVVSDFVEKGGYLLTTDWALEGCLQQAFPEFAEWDGGYTDSRVIEANVRDKDDSLTVGVVPRAHWKLDKKSQTVRIRNHNKVKVLVDSAQLSAYDGTSMGPLAITFAYGRGRVLHLVGHFDNNTDRAFNNLLPDIAPKIGISLRQAIAGNFVAEAIGANKTIAEQNAPSASIP
ncbi:MAG TPA: hypothetical protein V6D17_18020 [Candidatus Obscuribacterales bacterium]